uniref:Uncharacterized protein n=1 Tax=Rhizophora mucronata TaxID=61149 RepID=A0A2P2QSE5_RHIMU
MHDKMANKKRTLLGSRTHDGRGRLKLFLHKLHLPSVATLILSVVTVIR